MKKMNPKTNPVVGYVTMIIGVIFLIYWTHPIAPKAVAEWSKVLIVSIGIPLALVNIGLVFWATSTILLKLEEIKKNQDGKD